MERRAWFLHPLHFLCYPEFHQNLDTESLTHQPDMSVPNVESLPPGAGMNLTSIDFCGPWQPITGTNSSQSGFDFDSLNKALGGLNVSGPGHPRHILLIFLSGVPIWVRGYMFRLAVPLSKPVFPTPLAILFLVLFERKYGQGHTLSFPCCWNNPWPSYGRPQYWWIGYLKWPTGRSKTQLRAITNIYTWTTAFIVYMSIYLENFPGKAHEMLTYMHKIRLAASRVGRNGWSKYDSNIVWRRSATLLQ